MKMSEKDFIPTCNKSYDYECFEISHGGAFGDLGFDFDETGWFIALVLGSAFCDVLFFLAVFFIKELQVHPFKMFMVNALCEAFFLLNYVTFS
jgi:hypothetical protein